MGAYRDEQLFAQMDAQSHGYQAGSSEAEFLTSTLTAQALGIDREQIEGLCGRDVAVRLVGLLAISRTIEERVIAEQRRHLMYTSFDPAHVAEIIVEEQSDLGVDNDGLHDPLSYRFKIDDDGVCKAESERITRWTEQEDVNADWVMRRLEVLGVGQDVPFCAAVADQIIQALVALDGVTDV